MIALGGPKLKRWGGIWDCDCDNVSMIALGGPKLKLCPGGFRCSCCSRFNDSTGWA